MIGTWRPNSKLEPKARTRVAVKIMNKSSQNVDVHYLMSMDHPNVNHFLGEFATSDQLKITKGSTRTMMVSSYCGGGDHFSVLMCPEYRVHSDPFTIHLQCHAGDAHKFCFVNPEQPREVVNHAVVDVQNVYNRHGKPLDFSYLCICSDDDVTKGIIYRLAKIDEQFFSLWGAAPACPYPDKPGPAALQFTAPFALMPGQIVKCFLVCAALESHVAPLTFHDFSQCMPRPNVTFIRAFAFQMLRALGYCHSRKLTAHNGESLCVVLHSTMASLTALLTSDLRTVNISPKNPLMARHFLFEAPPLDRHATLRAMKVELGDFGCASALPSTQRHHDDFLYAAMAL